MALVSRESISLYSSSSSFGPIRSFRPETASFAGRRSVGFKIRQGPNRLFDSVSSESSRSSFRVSCGNQEVAVDGLEPAAAASCLSREVSATSPQPFVPPVTDATWDALVLKADGPVLVEFWASWCGPCRMIDPVIGKLANTYAGKLKFFKLNTDDSPSIATRYGIKSIPTTMFFLNGEKKDLVLGAVPETTLITSIEKIL